MSSQKDGLLKHVKIELQHVFNFSSIWQKVGKVFGKIPWLFGTILLIKSIVLFFITCDNYD